MVLESSWGHIKEDPALRMILLFSWSVDILALKVQKWKIPKLLGNFTRESRTSIFVTELSHTVPPAFLLFSHAKRRNPLTNNFFIISPTLKYYSVSPDWGAIPESCFESRADDGGLREYCANIVRAPFVRSRTMCANRANFVRWKHFHHENPRESVRARAYTTRIARTLVRNFSSRNELIIPPPANGINF